VSFQFVTYMPYYYQLKEELLSKLRTGDLKMGDQIPTEMDLVKQYGVSRPTVRRAIAELVQEGYLERTRGRGTFVAQPAVISDARVVTTFASEVAKSGRRHRIRLLKTATVMAVGALATDLRIAEGDGVFEITRLRTGDDEPLVLEISQVPVVLCPQLLDEVDLEHEGLYAALERLSRIHIARAEQQFQAISAGDELAKILAIRPGAPVMLWQGIAYGPWDQPVERLRVYYRGDRYRFSLQQHEVDSAGHLNAIPLGKPGGTIGVMDGHSRDED